MQKKTMIVAAMTVAASMAGFVLAGSAFAADWHEYQGRISAGQAYAIPVPAGAESLSFALVPKGENPEAKLVAFDANDERVGSFALGGRVESSDIVDPIEGAYVIFVYQLTNAELSIRLQADEPGALKVAKAEVVRKDAPIVREFEGALAKDVSVSVKEDPIFATILYTGTVENLNAKLDSPSGTVLTITNESGVSYAPGLAIGATDAREATMENLAPGTYRAHVTADLLDGSLWLTTLTYERPVILLAEEVEAEDGAADMPHKPHKPHGAHAAPRAPRAAEEVVVGAEIRTGVPTALDVTQSTLAIGLRSALAEVCAAEEEEEEGDEPGADAADGGGKPGKPEHGHDACGDGPGFAVVTVISPADELVGVVTLDSEEPIALLEDLEIGEYVLFVHGWADEDAEAAVLAAYPESLLAPIGAREIGLVEQVSAMDAAAPAESSDEPLLAFETPPLLLTARSEDALSVGYTLRVEGPAGTVFESSDPVKTPFPWSFSYYEQATLENLVAGEYAIVTDGLTVYAGTVEIHSLGYDRLAAFGEVVEEETEEEEEDGEAAPTAVEPLAAVAEIAAGLF